MNFRLLKTNDLFLGGLCIVLGVALQIQTTLFASDGYLGIRVSMADLILPFAGIFILFTLVIKQTEWPKWHLPKIYLWIAVLTAVLALSGLNAYFIHGQLGTWAIGNKLGGWPVLIAFLMMGGWVGTNATERHIQFFIKALLYFGLGVLVYQCIFAFLQCFEAIRERIGWYQYIQYYIPGLMKNRNAYALLMLAIYGFVFLNCFSKNQFIPPLLIKIYLFLFPAFLIFNASRAAVLASVFLLIALILSKLPQKKEILRLFSIIFLGSAFLFVFLHDKTNAVALINDTPKEIFLEARVGQSLSDVKENIEYLGDNIRLTILEGALELFKQNPIFGSGLGANLEHQKHVHGEIINIVDSTPIWLITETGILGFLIFCAFYILVVRAIILKLKQDDDFSKFIRLSTLFMILTFTVMCVFHEILYTRHIWFILGIALTLPPKTHHPEQIS